MSANATPTYRPDVDGLRALAIVPVIAFHAFPDYVRGGFVGVDVFFVISGYLISLIIFGGLDSGTFSFANFYARRIRRIFPALIITLFASLVWGWVAVFADEYAQLGKHTAAGAGFAANFTLWNEAGYFDAASERKPLLHLWSLGIEEQFYLFWPTVLYLSWKRRLNLLAVALSILAASFFINVVQVRSDEPAAFYSPITRLWELMLGGALAYLTMRGLPACGQRTVIRQLASAVGLSCIVFAAFAFSRDTSFPGWRAALPAGGALLMIAAGPDAWLNERILSHPLLVGVGLISYPLYLWHWPLLSFARIEQSGEPSAAIKAAAIAVSVVFAWLTYVAIERPIRFQWRGAAVIAALCSLMVAAGVWGYTAYQSEGFVDRAINRSDQAHFLQYYERLRKKGLTRAYRAECDFMDWDTEKTRSSIASECTQPGDRWTVFLWGDSYASALSHGIRTVLPAGARLAQVATSGCPPRLQETNPEALGGRCRIANGFAREQIAMLKPDVVVLAQILAHEGTDWHALADSIGQLGVKRVVLVGPVPQWLPSLPLVVARHYWGRAFDRVSAGLNPEMFDTDRVLRQRAGSSTRQRYVSLVSALCNSTGCLATVPGTDQQLIAVDQGHLSPAGSAYVAATILRPHLLPD